eukprot:54418-Pelagomonas_calceolata.AAC.1
MPAACIAVCIAACMAACIAACIAACTAVCIAACIFVCIAACIAVCIAVRIAACIVACIAVSIGHVCGDYGWCGHKCCMYATHGVAPVVRASAPAHSSTCRAEQQTNVEDSNSGKLCTTMYIIYTETQNHHGQTLSVGARQINRGQLHRGYQTFAMSLPTAPPGHPSTHPPMKLFAWPACRAPGRGVRWVGHAGHPLLSYQAKEFQNILPVASPT